MLLNTTKHLTDTTDQVFYTSLYYSGTSLSIRRGALRSQKLDLNLIKGRLLSNVFPTLIGLEAALPDEVALARMRRRTNHTQVKTNTLSYKSPATQDTKGFSLSEPVIQHITNSGVVLRQRILTAHLHTNTVARNIEIALYAGALLGHRLKGLSLESIVTTVGLNGPHSSECETNLLGCNNIHLVLLGQGRVAFGPQALGHA